jgi:hypothetical protein
MKRLKLLLASAAFMICLMPVASVAAATDVFQGACGVAGADSSTACQQTGADPLTGPDGIITRVTSLISFIGGAAALIMLLIAGLMFIVADGDSSKVASARSTAIYALVGLAVMGAAQGIVVFVLSRV